MRYLLIACCIFTALAWADVTDTTPAKPVVITPLVSPEVAAVLQSQEFIRHKQLLAVLAAVQAATEANPAPTPPVAASRATMVDLAPIRDTLLSIASALITGFIGIGLAWMSKHMTIMQDANMNSAITDSAQRLGALLAAQLQAVGQHISTVDMHNPAVASMATSLISNYPEFAKRLDLTPDKAANIILGEAAKLFTPTTAPVVNIAAPVTNRLEALADRLEAQQHKEEHHEPA
jgi:hypothetical protein